jgi:hypothetical protein
VVSATNRFNIVSTAECECGDGLQTEEHIFWDCKLYEDQRATVMGIPKVSYRTLKARRNKISARRLLLHKHSYIYRNVRKVKEVIVLITVYSQYKKKVYSQIYV